MVALPLFKLGALALRHVSKYGANYIKTQAHDHPRFRSVAERGGQFLHQLNMRFTVSAMRDPAAEKRAKERAEAPTVMTEEQTIAHEHKKAQTTADEVEKKKNAARSIWRRKFRPLPEGKAVDLFADVIGDTFILSVASILIIYEYVKASQKPDKNAVRIDELIAKLEDEERRIAELEEVERKQQERMGVLEQALQALDASRQIPSQAIEAAA